MKITNIKQQTKDSSRVSFFIDENYSFSLTIKQWQETGLKIGDVITKELLVDLKKQSDFGKNYQKALHYLARRKRSEREMRDYLKRKQVDPNEINQIINSLYEYKYLDDEDFARSWVNDRNNFKPSSKRKMYAELLKKGIEKSIIQNVLESGEVDEQRNLQHIITTKQKQSRYQDSEKLIAYLLRQGFSYSDVKTALDQQS